MKTKTPFATCIAITAALLTVPPVAQAQETKSIRISKESFGEIYPAVWFDPDKGTIHKLVERSEKPPADGAVLWIEPRDPEFALGPGIEGVRLWVALGHGDKGFSEPLVAAGEEPVSKIGDEVLRSEEQPVIVIETKNARSAIMIEDLDEEAHVLEFKWRLLDGGGAAVEPEPEPAGAGPKAIVVNKASFSDIYPAVWLDPGKGTIHKLTEKSEAPPTAGAAIWIEPSDPEFAAGPGIEDVTLCVVGYGDEVFAGTAVMKALAKRMEKVSRLEEAVLSSGRQPVVVIGAPAGMSAVVIDRCDSDAEIIEFRWRSLAEAVANAAETERRLRATTTDIVFDEAIPWETIDFLRYKFEDGNPGYLKRTGQGDSEWYTEPDKVEPHPITLSAKKMSIWSALHVIAAEAGLKVEISPGGHVKLR